MLTSNKQITIEALEFYRDKQYKLADIFHEDGEDMSEEESELRAKVASATIALRHIQETMIELPETALAVRPNVYQHVISCEDCFTSDNWEWFEDSEDGVDAVDEGNGYRSLEISINAFLSLYDDECPVDDLVTSLKSLYKAGIEDVLVAIR